MGPSFQKYLIRLWSLKLTVKFNCQVHTFELTFFFHLRFCFPFSFWKIPNMPLIMKTILTIELNCEACTNFQKCLFLVKWKQTIKKQKQITLISLKSSYPTLYRSKKLIRHKKISTDKLLSINNIYKKNWIDNCRH